MQSEPLSDAKPSPDACGSDPVWICAAMARPLKPCYSLSPPPLAHYSLTKGMSIVMTLYLCASLHTSSVWQGFQDSHALRHIGDSDLDVSDILVL